MVSFVFDTRLLCQNIIDERMLCVSEPTIAQVFFLGVCILLVGLINLVLAGKIIARLKPEQESGEAVNDTILPPSVQPVVSQEIPNRQEFVAAVSAAIAESMGKDVSAIRILSIKKI